ncbi:zinc finger protein 468-like isoform X2 [Ischnura elegans]|nr:zinc finger protein 468-like isoform X2 [Ischnura elegans]
MGMRTRSVSRVGKERKARIDQSDGCMSPMASGSSTDSRAVTFHQEEEGMLSQGSLKIHCVLNGNEKMCGSILTNGKDNAESNRTHKSGGNEPMNKNDGDVGGKWFGQGGNGNIEAGSSELLDKNPVFHGRRKRTIGVKSYKCSTCSRPFTRKADLQSHMRTHTGERPYKCSECYKVFTFSFNLKSHMRTHTGEKPYKCSVCHKAFTKSSNLQSHMHTHTGERPYKCSVCYQAFAQSGHLQTHMHAHTGERPYICSVCCMDFTKSSNLQSHMRIHTGERPYKCTICCKAFTMSHHLQRHIGTH